MRVSCSVAVFFAWLCAIAFSANLYATTLLPGEPIAAEHSKDGGRADTKSAVAIWDQAAAWVWAKQREFHRSLTRELRAMRGKDGVGWALVLMSFLYGVLHAAGPGHGKAVLTTYLLTHPHRLRRAVTMGSLASFLQGVTALLLVYGLIGLAGWLPRETETATLWAGRMSFVLLAIVGLYVLARAVVAVAGDIHRWRHADNHNHQDHAHGEHCGCRHLPSAAEIDTPGSRRVDAGVILAIGLRPCSGAVLVLILASVMDLVWHGALAVLAMSIGTAMTIVTLAVFATKAREWTSNLVAHRSPLWGLAGGGVGMLGGIALLLLGLLLLNTSFTAQSVLMG